MISFRDKVPKKVPGLSTASLPDIIFMLLFFFMISTSIRQTPLMVSIRPPTASEARKLEKKSLITYINVGTPRNVDKYGTMARVQINDAFQPVENTGELISSEREGLAESEKDKMIVAIRADREVEMGIITDIKQELRKANALKISYNSRQGSPEAVFNNF